MSNTPYVSALRPDATRIWNHLNDSKAPAKAQEIADALKLPYSSVVHHLNYLITKDQVKRFKIKDARGYYFGIIGREYDVEIREANSKPKPKARVKDQAILSPPVWWPYAEKYMTIPEIVLFEREREESQGKDYGRGVMAKRLISAMNELIDPSSDEQIVKLKETLTDQLNVVLNHVRAYEGILKALDKYPKADALRRALITENTELTQDDLNQLSMRTQHLWGSNQVHKMNESNYEMRNWILGLFHAAWNTMFSVEEILRVFPSMQKERVELVLSSEMNGDNNLFKERRAGRINKWNCAYPDYETGTSLAVAKMIHEKRILENMFDLASRGPSNG